MLSDIVLILIALLLIALIVTLIVALVRAPDLLFKLMSELTWRSERTEYPYRRYRYIVEDSPLPQIIYRAERSYELRLTWAAREMLIIPIAEQLDDGEDVNWNEVEKSVELLVQSMREESTRGEKKDARSANSIDLIRAFFKRFCNIPPFCKATSEGTR